MKNKVVYVIIHQDKIIGVVDSFKEAHRITMNKSEEYRYETWPVHETMDEVRFNTYSGKHRAIYEKYGKANKCEAIDCSKKSNLYEWALIKGRNYSSNREDYTMLCKSCHKKYDMNLETIRRVRKTSNKPVFQYSTSGVFIREWESATQASKHLNINRGNITGNLVGQRKTTGGFIFKFKNQKI
jgi:hypothetical protein